MRNLILTFLVLVITGPAFCEDTEKTKLPNDAASAMSMYEADAANLKADFDKAIATKTKALRVKLEKAQEAATKKGNLDGAMAVKAAIDKLPKDGTKAPEPLSAAAVGSWDFASDTGYRSLLTLTDKGVAKVRDNVGTYKVSREGKVTLNWQNGKVDVFTIDQDRKSGKGECSDGAGLVVAKRDPQ